MTGSKVSCGMSIQKKHDLFLYPLCRVRSNSKGGSGTVIYCEKNPDKPDEYLTFVLTNAHVVEDSIHTKKSWDSVLKKKVEKEFVDGIIVELFDYVKISKVNSSNSFSATIECYDKEHDLAILKLDSPKKVSHVASIIPKKMVDNRLKLFTEIVMCGCSLLHDPLPSEGIITSIKEVLDNKSYCLMNGDMIFGNSGGAIFLKDTGELIGVPSAVKVMDYGFSSQVMTFMGYFTHPSRMYEFIDAQCFSFLYNKKKNYTDAMKEREKKRKKALYSMEGVE